MPFASATIDAFTRPAALVLPLERNRVRCLACAHRCLVLPGNRGICKVRYNRAGTLYAPHGYVSSLNADPIEKKPLYHVLPGSTALTFGMLGCNFHCDYCQNWEISQALKDARASERYRAITPEELVEVAAQTRAKVIASSYNEPLISTEWSAEIFRLARERGIRTAYISNGYASPEVLEYLRPVLDCYKVDLKAMQPATYRQLGARLEPVLETIRRAVDLRLWVEVVTLLVPGLNDSADELRRLAEFLAGVSPDLPWHVTAFHPDYRRLGSDWTTPESISTALAAGRTAGLRYVYSGNLLDHAEGEDTRCPSCRTTLISRRDLRWGGRRSVQSRLIDGRCASCGEVIPGIWN